MSLTIETPGCAVDRKNRARVRYRTDTHSPSSALDALVIAYAAETPPPPPPLASDWWKPRPGVRWQWQLTGSIDTSFDVEMYDIDLFDTPQSTIDELHAANRVVICYFSAGSHEDWRPDAHLFPSEVLGRTLDGWPGEKWLDISNLDSLAPIMEARLDLAVSKGCDGVEPDNVDGYSNNTGFNLSDQDQIAYNRWLASAAHIRGLSIGLKNDLEQVRDLLEDFDWALNEECFEYNECDRLIPFIAAGKAVFGVEYRGSPDVFCPQANAMNFDWLKKRPDLDAWRVSCR
ncbi:MAG: endo alpha-1,4 polygalactosaminidase [Candidatus Competibacteraceae bacterium]|nr:endo alpha-1,4 polygalactosaminidase [Candidatus Competibacteraceae bacterium]